jgi:putative membrane protein
MEPKNPYGKFEKSELILRDELAIDRTVLANEATLLAYTRTTLTLVIAGMTFLNFITTGFLRWVGIAFIPLGLLIGVFGVFRFRRMRRMILAVRKADN